MVHVDSKKEICKIILILILTPCSTLVLNILLSLLLLFISGDADVVLADAGTGQILNTVHVNQKVRKLLAVGKRLIFRFLSSSKEG